MRFPKLEKGKVIEISEILKDIPCEKCNSCLMIRLMEMGLVSGDKIELVDHRFGLWLIDILSELGNKVSTIVLRDEEIEKVCIL